MLFSSHTKTQWEFQVLVQLLFLCGRQSCDPVLIESALNKLVTSLEQSFLHGTLQKHLKKAFSKVVEIKNLRYPVKRKHFHYSKSICLYHNVNSFPRFGY